MHASCPTNGRPPGNVASIAPSPAGCALPCAAAVRQAGQAPRPPRPLRCPCLLRPRPAMPTSGPGPRHLIFKEVCHARQVRIMRKRLPRHAAAPYTPAPPPMPPRCPARPRHANSSAMAPRHPLQASHGRPIVNSRDAKSPSAGPTLVRLSRPPGLCGGPPRPGQRRGSSVLTERRTGFAGAVCASLPAKNRKTPSRARSEGAPSRRPRSSPTTRERVHAPEPKRCAARPSARVIDPARTSGPGTRTVRLPNPCPPDHLDRAFLVLDEAASRTGCGGDAAAGFPTLRLVRWPQSGLGGVDQRLVLRRLGATPRRRAARRAPPALAWRHR